MILQLEVERDGFVSEFLQETDEGLSYTGIDSCGQC